jgi:hypothetical protein
MFASLRLDAILVPLTLAGTVAALVFFGIV